jgi:hypothetical protein
MLLFYCASVSLTNMGAAPALVLFCFYLFLGSLQFGSATGHFVVPWSTKKYGPDGPWQAVTITVGGNDTEAPLEKQKVSELSVYPGGSYESMTFTPSACMKYPKSLCGVGGTWSPDPDQADQQRVSWPANWTDESTGIHVEQARHVVLGLTINQRTAFNASLASASFGNVTYPNGKVSGVPLGTLALGAAKTVQEFGTNPSKVNEKINAYTFAGWLYDNKSTTSYSYGLHIGSAAFNYPGSLVFGGYNKGRVIEPVTTFELEKNVALFDITIGVASGGSPFNFTSKTPLLPKGQISVWLDPLAPYLSLPLETCNNLASVLPVTFDEDLKYYFWNTSDPNFAKIVTSPAYLGFAFPPKTGTTDNVVIKVPFALLNLTLEAPITNTPRQYFPCVPTVSEYKLGRAFLQAAFIGRNWNTGTSFLAQAPGPGPAQQGLGEAQHLDIDDRATMIAGFEGADLFVNSWKGQWSLLDSQQGGGGRGSQPDGDGNTSVSGGLSTGAKAGIGAGAAFGAIALLAASIFLWKRSAKNKASKSYAHEASAQPTPYHPNRKTATEHYAHQVHNGWVDNGPVAELPHTQQLPAELGDTTTQNSRH